MSGRQQGQVGAGLMASRGQEAGLRSGGPGPWAIGQGPTWSGLPFPKNSFSLSFLPTKPNIRQGQSERGRMCACPE